MIKGLYSSSNGMPPMLVRMEVISNNLANLNTTGFKKDKMFVEMMKDPGVAPKASAGELTNRLNVQRVIDFTDGSLQQTSNPLDVALQGDGFFVLQTAEGPRFTRNGNFTLALDGSLTTLEGIPVAGKDGQIVFPDLQKLAHESIAISPAGEITVGNEHIGTLRIVQFNDPSRLKKDGGSLFRIDEERDPEMSDKEIPTVKQGFLEESNVDGIAEMIEMIELARNFESNQKAIASQDATLDRVMDVGKF
jgi:flagellar basal-body rod protein FlgF